MNSSAKLWMNDQAKLLFKLPALVLVFLFLFSPLAPVFAEENPAGAPVDNAVSPDAQEPAPSPEPVPPEPAPSETEIAPDQTTTTDDSSVAPKSLQPQKLTLGNIDEHSGAFTYKYAIRVPSGRNDITTPDIALVYDSGNAAADSIVGSGWSINIPSIERINRKGTNNLYSTDYYSSSLSGELVKINSTDYIAKAEKGDFLKYTKLTNGWLVTDKSGIKYTFGANAQARQDNSADTSQVFKWMLEEVRDTNDNYVSYTYFKNAGQIYPSQVVYSGNGSTPGVFTVNFDRTSRSNAPISYSTSFSVQSNYRIAEIRTEVNSSWARKYTLSYIAGDNGIGSLLDTIVESGRDGLGTVTTLPAVNFDYQTSTNNWTYSSTLTNNLNNWYASFVKSNNGLDGGARMADVNGDGLQDMICNDSGSGSGRCASRVFLNNGAGGWTDVSSTWLFPLVGGTGTARESFVDVNDDQINHADDLGLRVFDINGDGLADLVKKIDGDTGVYLNNGSGWTYNAPLTNNLQNTWISPFVKTNNGRRDGGLRVADINGDGLLDMVWHNEGIVCSGTCSRVFLNNGAGGWTDVSTTWLFPLVGGTGTSRESFVYEGSSGQINYAYDEGLRIFDINGDGLADLVKKGAYGTAVYVNNGSGWTYNATLTNNLNNWYISFTSSTNGRDGGARMVDINGDGLLDVICHNDGTSGQCGRVLLNNGAGGWTDVSSTWLFPLIGGTGTARESFVYVSEGSQILSRYDEGLRTEDINGDGLADLVKKGAYGDGVYLNNTTTKSNLLNKITYYQGGNTTITYKVSSLYMNGSTKLNPSLPMTLSVVNQITNNDSSGIAENHTYEYAGGNYYFTDPLNRKFAGFNSIKVTDATGNVIKTYYHQGNTSDSTNGEYNDSESKIGNPYRVEAYDNVGNLYSKTINKWDESDLGSGAKFAKLIRSTTEIYDGNATHEDTAEEYTYGNYGNLTQKVSWGEVSATNDGSFTDVGNDKFTENISYASNTGNYVVGFPSQDTVLDQSSNKIRESKMYYDNLALGSVNLGNQTKIENWKTGSTYINSQKAYNSYGLVTSDIDPRGKTTNYVYDSYNLYPTTVTDPLNHSVTYLYNYSLGQPKQVTDQNNFVYQTTFDAFGRVTEEKIPDPQTGSLATKATYQYTDTPNTVSIRKTDYLDSANSVDTYQYFDGLGRKIQDRKETENGYLAKDYAYDSRGLLQKESLPYASAGTSKTSPTTNTSLYTNYTYDGVGRTLASTNSLGNTSYVYDDWKTTVTDPNGKIKNYYKDAYGNLAKVDEKNGASTYSTSYIWDGNKNLTKITDALGNVRSFTYNSLGRRLSAEDLHAPSDSSYGTWNYVYDDAGNMTESTSPDGKIVDYAYDSLNRPLSEDYTGGTGVETAYIYDTAPNGTGKLGSVSANGTNTSYSYDSSGGVSGEIKTINAVDYSTGYSYDRQGNILEITNPDSSKVKYTYNTAGKIETVQRKEDVDSAYINFITNVDYSPTEQATTIAYANGVTTTNTYDPTKLYRLITKVTTGPGGNLQNIVYTYDPVGNITRIVDASATDGAKTVNYVYDDLYRLTSATAIGVASGQNSYTENYVYNELGNITSGPRGTYLYGGNIGTNYANPHAPTSVNGIINTYDKDGNLISDGTLTNTWNYKGQLASTTKDALSTNYYYDQGGARVWAQNNGSNTYYVNKYYNIDDSAKKTKNIYTGDELVGTVETVTIISRLNKIKPLPKADSTSTKLLGSQTPQNLVRPPICLACNGGTPILVTTPYYNHVDHLNSVNVVTDQNGGQVELLDYYPYGAPRISTGDRTSQRQYIGQIYDTDTGLNYLNARYYKGSIGQFISEDPVFLNPEGSGPEIFSTFLKDPQSQNAYSYAGNNPITFSDPDGKWYKEFLTGQQSWSNLSSEVGDATQYMSDGWQTAMDHPYATGVAVGVAGGLATYGTSAVIAQAVTGVNLGRLSELPMHPRVDTLAKTGFSAIKNATGLTKSEAIQAIQATGRSLIDVRNSANINNLSNIGNKVIRITTDPSATKIISSGVISSASKVQQYVSTGAMRALPAVTSAAKIITKVIKSLMRR